MSIENSEIAKAFSSHNFEKVYPFLHDDIRWNLVGGQPIEGKENVIETCNQSAEYLKGTTTKFSRFKTIAAGERVVIDSVAEYIDSENKSNFVASCDIYEFKNNGLSEITSYCIELENL